MGAKALSYSHEIFPRARNKILVSFKKPKWYDGDFQNLSELSPYQGMSSFDYENYNKFCIWQLAGVSDADFIIGIEPDGMIINPESWSEEFLEYDYIGAPWNSDTQKLFDNNNCVGNGGFCLRSKRFLELSAKIDQKSYEDCKKTHRLGGNEDLFLCKYKYNYFIENGIKFAPPEVAAKFSFEEPIHGADPKTSFGFHGKGQPIYQEMTKLLKDYVEKNN